MVKIMENPIKMGWFGGKTHYFWKQPSRNNPTFASFGVPFSRLRLASRRARYDEALGLNQKRWNIGIFCLSVYQKTSKNTYIIYQMVFVERTNIEY